MEPRPPFFFFFSFAAGGADLEEIERDAAQQQQQPAQFRERARHEGLHPQTAHRLCRMHPCSCVAA